MGKQVKDIKEIKVGDFIMLDGGGVAYARFAEVEEISKEKIYLKNIYTRKRVDLYPGDTTAFNYERSMSFYETACGMYLISESDYKAIQDAYERYSKVHEQTCDVFRKIYFDQKRK